MSPIMNDVFISYSRRDQAFVKTLDAAFRRCDRDPWIDWEDIRKGEEWWKAIQRGIEGADTFVFVLSPDSVASAVCREEIEHAVQHHKRFLPIVYREGFEMGAVHPQISSHNWLFFREGDDFEQAFQDLQTALDTDLDHVRAHTRLLLRALEWRDKGRGSSYLLRGTDLTEAEQWLVQGAAKVPQPTECHSQYIAASHAAKVNKLKAIHKGRRTVILTTIAANLSLVIFGGIWLYRARVSVTLENIQTTMIKALHMARENIDGDRFTDLTALSPGDAPTPLYTDHQDWLASVRRVFPDMLIRTYVAGGPDQLLWVGDVSRGDDASLESEYDLDTEFLEPAPAWEWQQEVLVGQQEFIPPLAQGNTAELLNGQESIIMQPYALLPGSNEKVISAAEPIRDAAGNIVGVIQVDYTETDLLAAEREVIKALLIAFALIFGWQVIISWIVLRILRPIVEP
jgi:hypothetical protein